MSGWEAKTAARGRREYGGVFFLEGEEVVGVVGLGEEVGYCGDCGGGGVVAAEDEEFQLGEGGGGEGWVGGGGWGLGGLEFGVGEVDDGFAFGGEWGGERGEGREGVEG